jgi:hypothetical protein
MSKDEKVTEPKGKAVNTGQYKKGCSGGPGRPKGVPNKVTQELKDSFKMLAEDNVDKLQDALDTLFEDDPAKAIQHFLALSEYVTPKLARTEMTGADQGPLTLYLVDRIEDPEAGGEDDSD